MEVTNRFIAGAALGSILTAAAGAVAASFGMGSVNGIVVAAFVGVVAGAASVVGGAI
jgi:hypothetical protein